MTTTQMDAIITATNPDSFILSWTESSYREIDLIELTTNNHDHLFKVWECRTSILRRRIGPHFLSGLNIGVRGLTDPRIFPAAIKPYRFSSPIEGGTRRAAHESHARMQRRRSIFVVAALPPSLLESLCHQTAIPLWTETAEITPNAEAAAK